MQKDLRDLKDLIHYLKQINIVLLPPTKVYYVIISNPMGNFYVSIVEDRDIFLDEVVRMIFIEKNHIRDYITRVVGFKGEIIETDIGYINSLIAKLKQNER